MAPGHSAWPPHQVSGQVVTALPEVLIVSVECPLKDGSPGFYQGALLRIPAQQPPDTGVAALGPLSAEDFALKLAADNPRDYLLDHYPSLAHRHTYFQAARDQPNAAALESRTGSKSGGSGAGGKKLGVRLRARQVLCNKCKNVCNERGENVQHKAQRKTLNHCQSRLDSGAGHPGRRPSIAKAARNAAGPSTGSLKKLKISPNNTLVPRLKRLNQSDIDRLSDRSSDGYDDHSGEESPVLDTLPVQKAMMLKRQDNKAPNSAGWLTQPASSSTMAKPLKIKLSGNAQPMAAISPIVNSPPVLGPSQANVKEGGDSFGNPVSGRTLRRKRCAVGSMEDLWDETVFEDVQVQTKSSKKDASKTSSVALSEQKTAGISLVKNENSSVSAYASGKPETSGQGAKLLKIFYGSRGKETVLKIPASQLQAGTSTPSQSDTDENEENAQMIAKKSKDASKKAAKKALKRARKEAQRRAQYGSASPGSYLAGRSPAYRGGRSPIPSPVRMVSPFAHPGGFSPGRYGYSPAYASYSPAHSKSPAYSVSLPQNSPESEAIGARKIKHKRKKHKKKKPDDALLSSNVKVENEVVATSSGLTSGHNIFVDDEVISSDQVRIWGSFPPFVETDAADIGGQTVDSAEMENGTTMHVGTLIWGKIPNHPWWPGKDCFSHSASRNLTYKYAVEMANQEDEQTTNNVFGLGSSTRISQTQNTPTHISTTSPGGSFSPRTVDCLS
ncbi:hypothetical protein TCAL_10935 [Tigriopus californicus]|uniref:PWWP domain-containing protein n=1 Tax=Tigriopus californicus TaxID=6832 RepID=A0A553PHM2_TIGCA|nr:hypothetical protein TCAL_10935 [Tigriopus californicus]